MVTHPFITTLKTIKGNARGVILTEPLWGIPHQLIAPYTSLYMLALGLSDSQIGLVASIGLTFQIFFALISGAITDKYGRKRTTLFSDLASWSVPTLIWASAQNFGHFILAAIVNSSWRIPMNSWTCLLVEDTDQELLVDVYSWIYISGLLAAFFAPIAGVLINFFSLVPTMRGLYLFAFAMMTAKILIMNSLVNETAQGKRRIEATRGQKLTSMLGEYKQVLHTVVNSPPTMITTGIMLVLSVSLLVNNTFWSIIVTEKLHIPAEHIAIFPFARSIIMLFFFFMVMPKIRNMNIKKPMLVGFFGFAISQLILITVPEKSYILLLISIFLEACSIATLNTLKDKMVVINIDETERARIMAIVFVIVICLTSPFGWIAGELSEINRVYPFIMNISLFVLGGVLTFIVTRVSPPQSV